jgi:autotransporter-associated beta strand protein
MRFAKCLLVAAALVGGTATPSKAYDLYNSGWNYTQPNWGDSNVYVGQDFQGTFYRQLDSRLVNAGVYRGATGVFAWYWNEYFSFPFWVDDYAAGSLGTSDNAGNFDYSFDFQSAVAESGYFAFNSASSLGESTNIAIGQTWVGVFGRTDGDDDTHVGRSITVYERTVQVARTGSGIFGANAFSAFEGDNSETLSGAFYNASIVGRNVLPKAFASYDGEGGYGPELAGSVVRVGDIALGFSGAEGLFAKDGGWLDIRGDLTLGAGGTIYIRDGEITSNVYTQYYSPGTLDTIGVLAIDSGILSVRSHFAQDMVATWGQTLGFRDGAVNNSRLYLNGLGFGFDGEGFGDGSNGIGALRSITGENVQNGNISVIAEGEGFGGALIGVDLGSKLTINGAINGLNSFASEGGADLGFNTVGNAVVNGVILSGIDDVYKLGAGELLLTAGNLFTGDVEVAAGSLRITHSGALSGASGDTYVQSGASLVLDHATGLSLVDDIHIRGDGNDSNGGAIRSLSGTNSTSGDVILDADATIRVDAGSTFTVEELFADGEGSSTLTLDTHATFDAEGDLLLNGHFRANGSTNGLGTIVKTGAGTAAIATVDGALELVDVRAGTLSLIGSSSSAGSPHDNLVKEGAGDLELLGDHHYGDVNFEDGITFLRGNLTLQGWYDNGDFDIRGNAVVNVEDGATLTHVSTDGEGGFYTNGFDLQDNGKLSVKTGGTVNLNDAEIDLEDDATLEVAGVFTSADGIYANDDSTVEVLDGGVINADIEADERAKVTLRTGGRINGDVTTWESAEFLIESGAIHDGNYTAYGSADIVVNGTIGDGAAATNHVFDLSGSARLSGSGVLTGSLIQSSGTVAPGNSTDVLTVLGNYSISAGNLEIEIGGTDGPGNDPTGNDQLAVGGTITVGGSAVLEFKSYNDFLTARGNPAYQILATELGAARATIGTFDTVENDTGVRILFDHSTGRAYGTGLSFDGGTFRDYGSNGNRREIGRALWMEAVARDNSNVVDENFDDFAINNDGPGDETGQLGRKTFLLTRDAAIDDATQVGTDLGAAAAMVLTASDVGAALDSLSPEVYVGFTELSTRLNRNFSLLGATGRRSGDEKKWGFNLGYSGEQLTSNGASAYSSFKAGTNTTYLTADIALGDQTHLNLSLGTDDGDVRARDFNGDTDSALAGIGIGYTTDSGFARIDLGAAFSTTDIRAVRQGGVMDQDDQDAYAVSLRVTFLPKDPPLKPVVAGQPAATPSLSIIPYVGISYGSSSLDGFTESESEGSVQLSVSGYDRKSLIGEVGFGLEYALGANTTLTGVLAYEHEFDSKGETDLVAAFAEDGVSDTEFGIRSDGIGSGIFRLGFGIRQNLGTGASVGLSYDALMGSGIDSGHHLKADVSFRF